MLHTMAYGGSLGNSLFNNVSLFNLTLFRKHTDICIQAAISSPYLPGQYGFADSVPSQAYHALAQAVGCLPKNSSQGSRFDSIFQCLVSTDTITLQNASAYVNVEARYGTWAFLPVTDGTFVQQLPSQQLLKNKRINGAKLLIGVSSLRYAC